MIGQTISHYHITEKLGEGGMGVVYKAQDTNLDRTVALKFLPSRLTNSGEDKQRFVREAKAAAAMNHPNICTIYGVGEHEGRQFISMEYIEGQTLQEKIEEGDLDLQTVIDYGLQGSGALAEAHDAGIVHRDIKPGNIMVDRKGRIKVMDFGLAKQKGTGEITKTGSTVGTTAFMSPEQIQGGEVDHRADIFSFGVVLYQMLAGQKPFRGEHEAAMMYAIVNEEPTPIRKFLPEAPELLERIFRRSLTKDPGERYATAAELNKELSALQDNDAAFIQKAELPDREAVPSRSGQLKSGSGSTTISMTLPAGKSRLVTAAASILLLLAAGVMIYYFVFAGKANPLPDRIPVAVTDFVNETGTPELDGLSGMLITSLEQSNRLLVMPRSRMFDILDQQGVQEISYIDESLGKQVARAADLRALVTASIHQFGEVYTIDLKILDTQRDEYLFTVSEQGEGKESIPKMLDRLSEQIREDFQGPNQQDEMDSRPVAELTTPNLEAYQHYFKGQELINKMRFEEAEEQFRRAIALDPEFALAYYRLGYSLSWRGIAEADKYYNRALEYIDKAPPKEQMMIRVVTRSNRKEQIELLKKVLEQYPQEKEALFMMGDAYFHSSQMGESVRYLGETLKVDPSHQRALQHIIWALSILHDEREIEFARKYVNEVPNTEAYYLLAEAYYYHGYKDQAIETFRQGQLRFPENADLKVGPCILYMYEGQFDKAAEIYRPLIKSNRLEDRIAGLRMSVAAHLYKGRISLALETLDKMAEIYRQSGEMVNLRRVYAQQFKIAAAYLRDNNHLVDQYEQKIVSYPPNEIYSRFNTNEAYISLGEFKKVSSPNLLPDYDRYVDGLVAFEAEEFDKTLSEWKEMEVFGYRRINGPNSLYRISHTYMELGRYKEAIELAEKITRNGQQLELLLELNYLHMFWHPRNLYLLGQIYERKGEEARALEYYNRFLEQWKDADETLSLLKEVKQRAANFQD